MSFREFARDVAARYRHHHHATGPLEDAAKTTWLIVVAAAGGWWLGVQGATLTLVVTIAAVFGVAPVVILLVVLAVGVRTGWW
ncbi:hypothetical protein GCM10009037_17000 [Halarchaeum grantii]|uniref:Uncharacterized protein n=1 Tax=Halarchaeum grantii TaxID=1193105 RepID=A0A830F2E5_9EURY|nr:hypothetical protein [Halarchaeum grantii]GGL33974.1 hypothetical protein GCM10009037_17000 [Halarchaeum grantii]